MAARQEKIFGPPNGRIIRAAKKRRKELDAIQSIRPTEFQELLKKYDLDNLSEEQNALKIEEEDDKLEEGEGAEDEDSTLDLLFWKYVE